MSDNIDINYGPLKELIGVWKGDKGLDIAPDPDGIEKNPYYETISYSGIGDVKNAESQVLSVVHYRQIVQRKSNDKIFHDQTGYWMWDSKTEVIMHSLTIPRGVCVLAGGIYNSEETSDNCVILEVEADVNDKNWQIIQSPFMQNNARSIEFRYRAKVGNNKLTYAQTTMVKIYDDIFEHTDKNELIRQ